MKFATNQSVTPAELYSAMWCLDQSSHVARKLSNGEIVFFSKDGEVISGYIAKTLAWYSEISLSSIRPARRPPEVYSHIEVTIKRQLAAIDIDDEVLVKKLCSCFKGNTVNISTEERNQLVGASWRLGVRGGSNYFYDKNLNMLCEHLQKILEELVVSAVCD